MNTNNVLQLMIDQTQLNEGVNSSDNRIMHEVMQQIAIAGLYRGGFFNDASFYGGTCLRIFHGLNRFSEDLDFSLDEPNKDFNINKYFKPISEEFETMGIPIEITKKEKTTTTNIESAFLKSDTHIYDIGIIDQSKVRIKLEVDTNPPPRFSTEGKLMRLPFSLYVKCYQLPDLYAGKMHALIYRGWRNRVKGRDWYDFDWYVRNNIKLNLDHFASRAYQFNGEFKDGIGQDEFKALLTDKINSTDIDSAKKDVEFFIREKSELDIWSKQYFLDLIPFIKF